MNLPRARKKRQRDIEKFPHAFDVFEAQNMNAWNNDKKSWEAILTALI